MKNGSDIFSADWGQVLQYNSLRIGALGTLVGFEGYYRFFGGTSLELRGHLQKNGGSDDLTGDPVLLQGFGSEVQ